MLTLLTEIHLSTQYCILCAKPQVSPLMPRRRIIRGNDDQGSSLFNEVFNRQVPCAFLVTMQFLSTKLYKGQV